MSTALYSLLCNSDEAVFIFLIGKTFCDGLHLYTFLVYTKVFSYSFSLSTFWCLGSRTFVLVNLFLRYGLHL